MWSGGCCIREKGIESELTGKTAFLGLKVRLLGRKGVL
jgi:hypothetical protein